MKKDSRIIIGLAVALLITFLGIGISLIPNLNNGWYWLFEGLIVMWILVTSWFIFTFIRFNKQKKGS